MFKIDIASIKNEHGKAFSFEIVNEIEQLFDQEVLVTWPVVVKGEISNINGELIFTGNISVQLELQCSRCLAHFPYSIEKDLVESFGRTAMASKRAVADIEGAEDKIINGDHLDFQPLVEETIVLNLPMKYICSVDCKGLCSQCGCNLNEEQCNCHKQDIDPRLEILTKLKNEF